TNIENLRKNPPPISIEDTDFLVTGDMTDEEEEIAKNIGAVLGNSGGQKIWLGNSQPVELELADICNIKPCWENGYPAIVWHHVWKGEWQASSLNFEGMQIEKEHVFILANAITSRRVSRLLLGSLELGRPIGDYEEFDAFNEYSPENWYELYHSSESKIKDLTHKQVELLNEIEKLRNRSSPQQSVETSKAAHFEYRKWFWILALNCAALMILWFGTVFLAVSKINDLREKQQREPNFSTSHENRNREVRQVASGRLPSSSRGTLLP
ncbi:MAG: hypothetical protein AAFY98_04935, partial [Verrucomicrobiota bacterium]